MAGRAHRASRRATPTRLWRLLLLTALTLGAMFVFPGASSALTCCWKVDIKSEGTMFSDFGPKDPNDTHTGTHGYSWSWSAKSAVSFFPGAGQGPDFSECPAFTEAFRCAPIVRQYSVRENSDFGGGHVPCSAGDASDGLERTRGSLISMTSDPRALRMHPKISYDDDCWKGVGGAHTTGPQEWCPDPSCQPPAVFYAFFQEVSPPPLQPFRQGDKKISPGVFTPKQREEVALAFGWSFDLPPGHDPQNDHRTTGSAETTITFKPFPAGTVAHPGKHWREELARLKKLGQG
jgi:hypothetical protein